LAAIGAIAYEAIERLIHPQPVATIDVIIVAAVAIGVNGLSAWLLSGGRRSDINTRSAFLHMVADAGVSVAVVLAAVGIMFTGWQWLDPAASLVISVVILWGTWNLLREATRLILNAAPHEIDPSAVGDYLAALPEVASVHDLHIWAMSTRETALSCHLVTPGGHPGDAFLRRVAHDLQHTFDIDHATLQVELADGGECPLRCELRV
jgi:cobalt-zinc-cadmium efflux system protein